MPFFDLMPRPMEKKRQPTASYGKFCTRPRDVVPVLVLAYVTMYFGTTIAIGAQQQQQTFKAVYYASLAFFVVVAFAMAYDKYTFQPVLKRKDLHDDMNEDRNENLNQDLNKDIVDPTSSDREK